MTRRFRLLGLVLLALAVGMIGYAWWGEEAARRLVRAPEGTFGFAPFDLLMGRTRYENRGRNLYRLEMGPQTGERIVLARAGFGVLALAVVVLLLARRARSKNPLGILEKP